MKTKTSRRHNNNNRPTPSSSSSSKTQRQRLSSSSSSFALQNPDNILFKEDVGEGHSRVNVQTTRNSNLIVPTKNQFEDPMERTEDQTKEQKQTEETNEPLLYPEVGDPDFAKKLASKREFQLGNDKTEEEQTKQEENEDMETKAERMCKGSGSLWQDNQRFLRNFLSPETPYNGLLLYHGQGMGKIDVVMGILASIFSQQKILIVASHDQQVHYRRALLEKNTRGKKGRAPIEFLGYLPFAALLERKTAMDDLQGRFVVIDEIHHLRPTEDNLALPHAGQRLLQVAEQTVGMRLLLLSSSPVYNDVREIIWLANVLRLNDKLSPLEDTKQPLENNNNNNTTTISTTLLKTALAGYVSYIRGENPFTYPFRAYPSSFDPDQTLTSSDEYPLRQLNGQPIDTPPIQHVPMYVMYLPTETTQARAYHDCTKHLLSSVSKKTSIKYSDLHRPLQLLNMAYPSSLSSFSSSSSSSSATCSTLKDCMTWENTPMGRRHYKYKDWVLQQHGRIFSRLLLADYGAKLYQVCEELEKSEGLALVFTQYEEGGLVPMALALEEDGYVHVDGMGLLGHPKPYAATTATAPKKYMIITDNTSMSSENDELRVDPAVRVILISRSSTEGLRWKGVRQIHILDPWYNMNRIEALLAHGIFHQSHCALPFRQRNVQIYLYATRFHNSSEEAADMYLYRMSEKKAIELGKITRLLKEISIDCASPTSLEDFTKPMAVRQTLSYLDPAIRDITLSIDNNNSHACDYMSCLYSCPSASSDSNNMDTSTFQKHHLSTSLKEIISKIQDLYRLDYGYSIDDLIRRINVSYTYPVEEIYYALRQMISFPKYPINNNNVLYDRMGRQGYLIQKKQYFVFQPLHMTDTRVSMLDRERMPQKQQIPTASLILASSPKESNNNNNNIKNHNVWDDLKQRLDQCLHPMTTSTTTTTTLEAADWYDHVLGAIEILRLHHPLSLAEIRTGIIHHFLDTLSLSKREEIEKDVVHAKPSKQSLASIVQSYFASRNKNFDKEKRVSLSAKSKNVLFIDGKPITRKSELCALLSAFLKGKQPGHRMMDVRCIDKYTAMHYSVALELYLRHVHML